MARCMKQRWHRHDLVVWSSSAGPVGRAAARGSTRHTRTRRIRRWIRAGVLFAVIGLMCLARAVRARRGAALLLAGTVLTVAGIVATRGVIVVCGMLVLLRGVAVILGVSELHRRLDGEPAGGVDVAGFRTPPYW